MEKQTEDKWIKSMVSETFAEQRKTRRWGIFFKGLTFIYLLGAMIVFFNSGGPLNNDKKNSPHTAMIKVNGIIAADKEANANIIVSGLRSAFENEFSKAVMLVINSPGGSPVQAGYVFDEIKRLRLLYPDKKLYAVIADLGASGG